MEDKTPLTVEQPPTPGRRSTPVWRDWVLLATALAVIGLDQVTKQLVVSNMTPGQSIPPDAPVRLTYVVNTGAAFGLFQDRSAFFIVVAVVAIGLIVFYYRYLGGGNIWVKVALGMQLGGAIGNLIDRLRYGHVIDFIDFRFWPVFNVADSSICIGVGVLAVLLLFSSGGKPTELASDRPGGPPDAPRP